jgi:copper homeostasis protein (lipoprotein)
MQILKPTLPFVVLSFVLLSCQQAGNDPAATSPETSVPDPAHTSMNALDWAGTYTGTVPCADCEGIVTTLTIDRSNAYTLTLQYLGKSAEVYTKEGVFGWETDGNRIRMQGVDGAPLRFQVGENQLFQLDEKGERITGGLEERYILRRAAASAWPLLGTYWKLVELEGKPVAHPEGRMPANMLLNAQENRVSGNSGCNSFFSTYELDEGAGRIRFEQAGSTKMACQDMSTEEAFHKALLQVENFTLTGSSLALNNARMAPLLRFEAVEM